MLPKTREKRTREIAAPRKVLRKHSSTYLVVDSLVQVLHEDVAYARAAEGRVALGPHDTARLVLDGGEVHRVQSALGCKWRTDEADKHDTLTNQ